MVVNLGKKVIGMNQYQKKAAAIPMEDRPIPRREISGLGNFFGIYGGEHIAATEFVIGATMVTWGVKASDILLGLIIGNILATLTYAFICAPIAVDTRTTLYSHMKKVLGPVIQKIYNVIWGLASIAMAASMLTVSASSLREIFHIRLQTHWYPTDIKYVAIVIILGIIVTVVAANGFNAVAKFSSVCVPWMIIVFLGGFCVVVPELIQVTGAAPIHNFHGFMNLMNTYVWNGTPVGGGPRLNIFHVIGFTWMCNLAYHGGCNDMAMFRYAKKSSYGFVTAYGMFIGHFFAWASAGIMGATAAIILNKSLLVLDSGAITNAVMGITGLIAVVVAGWTTANPNLYRAALSYETIFDKLGTKKLTYIIGAITTVIACFPAASKITVIVNVIVLVVPAIGAIVFAEHWIIPKLGGTRYWSTYKGWKVNWAGLITWVISLLFVLVMTLTHAIHSYFLFLPNYLLAMVLYVVLALAMGARNDYTEQKAEDEKVQEALDELVNAPIEGDKYEDVPKHKAIRNTVAWISYAILAAFAVVTILVAPGVISVAAWKVISAWITLGYFVFGGLKAFFTYGNTKKVPVDVNDMDEDCVEKIHNKVEEAGA